MPEWIVIASPAVGVVAIVVSIWHTRRDRRDSDRRKHDIQHRDIEDRMLQLETTVNLMRGGS